MARRNEAERLLALTEYERPLWAEGLRVGGVDEVGRGPLAGPVYAACVILPPEPLIEGVNDSKKLSAKRREDICAHIDSRALAIGVGVVDAEEIDRINIRQATLRAMRIAVEQAAPDHLLVDAETVPIEIPQTRIIHGDALSYLIGAASIAAKVRRDAFMCRIDGEYPMYGFARNKGYGTREHIEAIRKYGLCPYHRRSFTGNFV